MQQHHLVTPFLLLLACISLSAGCTPQNQITGEPTLLGVDILSGELVDRDVIGRSNGEMLGVVPHQGEMIAISFDGGFLRHLNKKLNSRILVYAEVYDDGTDNPATALTRVLFEQEGQPEGTYLGVSDRLLYGPTPFKGYPIRVRFYIVNLVKEQEESIRRLLDGIGTIASTAQPEAAPAVGLILSVAQFVNALQDDDFELRYDVTLHPLQSIGRVESTHKDTLGNEPTQRMGLDGKGRMIAAATPLRTGPYVIIKRETQSRDGKRTGAADPSVRDPDYAREGGFSIYREEKKKKADVKVAELLRLEGGTLWRTVLKIYPRATKSATQPSKGRASVVVVPSYGPNKGVPTTIYPGYRDRFRDATYVSFRSLTGLPQDKAVSAASARASSDRDVQRIKALLDNPDRLALTDSVAEEIDAVAAALKTVLQQRRIANAAASRVGADPSFRVSTKYPAFWASQIQVVPNDDGSAKTNAVASNRAILPILEDLVIDFPLLSPEELTHMQLVERLVEDDFVPITTPDGAKASSGRFKLSDAKRNEIAGALKSATTQQAPDEPES